VTAGITFWCDRESAYGLCPQRITVTTTDLAAARAAAEHAGWQLKASGDLCALYHAPRPAPRPLKPRRIR
jgi:hypothetical protein